MTATIALVDDDRNILTSVAIAREAEGFKVRSFTDGAEALRGAGDVWIPTLWQIGWAWLIAVPCGAYFAFTLGYGPNGLMGGIFVGVVVAAVGHALRFQVVSRRDVARI